MYWDEDDFRFAGMLTRRALDGVSHPLTTPCRKPHVWDLDQEDGILYLYCTECQITHKLQKDKAIGGQDLPIRW